MTKKDLIAHLAAHHDLTKAQADRAFEGLCSLLAQSLKAGDSIALPGVGTLKIVGRPARTARNPSTGAAIPVPARRVVKFTTSSVLRQQL